MLQIDGTKRWHVHERAFADPLPDQPWQQHRDEVAARAAQPPLIDAELQPGDALYLPRGTVHAATAGEQTSIHLTVGIHPVTRYQLVEHLLGAAREVAELRAPLPPGVDLADPDVLAPHLAATVEALHAHLDAATAQQAAVSVGAELRRLIRAQPIAPLAQLAAAAAVTSDTRLRLRPGLRFELRRDAGQYGLELSDGRVELGPVPDAAAKILLGGATFIPGDLGMDDDAQLALVARLLRAGVLVPA